MTSYEPHESDEPRGWSPLAVALIATLVLFLGLAGAVYGIRAADRNVGAPASPLPQGFPTPTANATPTPSPTATPTATDTFPLPDLTTADFQAARAKVRDLKLGWQLVFEGTDPADASVRATDPPAGTGVRKGTTVKIFVRGAAPLADVPDVSGLPCALAASQLVDRGLYPEYATGRDGVVQDAAVSDGLHWNDRVKLTCG